MGVTEGQTVEANWGSGRPVPPHRVPCPAPPPEDRQAAVCKLWLGGFWGAFGSRITLPLVRRESTLSNDDCDSLVVLM